MARRYECSSDLSRSRRETPKKTSGANENDEEHNRKRRTEACCAGGSICNAGNRGKAETALRHNGNIVITPIITKQRTMENTGQPHSSWSA